MSSQTIPAENFVQTLSVNVDNENLTDEQFREFDRNTLPIVKRPYINTGHETTRPA